MNIEPKTPGRLPAALLAAAVASMLGASAGAQVLSPPVQAPAQPAAPASAAASAQTPSQPLSPSPTGAAPGSPGYHDPRSPFKPLEEREGVVSWKLLGTVKIKVEKSRAVPVFPQTVQALNNRPVKVQGFMMPLEPGDKQRHFLLSSVPTSCGFCVPAGPEGLVEVRTKAPVRYTLEPVTVEGKLAVLESDPYGVFYRIAEGSESR
jgi:hypothetical protein